MIKRILSAVLAVTMLGSIATVIASAKEAEAKTYNYVCLGDSIAAGYGLTAPGTAVDPALILSEDLIANPVQTAYAQVFGERLAAMGAEKGYTTKATNIASTAYRAEDVAKTIYQQGYKGEVAAYILEAFVGAGASEALVPYHDIYRKYIDEADMVSIQLGGNDIVMGIIYPMIKSDNPILNDTATAVALLLFGRTPEEAIGAGAKLIIRDKDKITSAHVAEAVKFFSAIKKDAEKYVENSANNVESVVSAVEDVNPDADIALIGMYNPYGNSLEYQGQVRDACTVMKNMFVRAVDEAVDINIEVGDVEIVPVQEAEQKSEDLKQVSFSLQKYLVDNSYFKEMKKERLKALLTIAADELAYPIQYLTAGKNVDPQMRLLNEKLQVIAEEHGATYVNVYDISNECNTDPHPTVEGHKEIADRLEAAMADTILEKMSAVDPEPEKEVLLGDVDGDGEVTVMDALAMQKYVADKPVKDFVVEAADINGDGVVDTNDTILIQKYTSGKTVKYPIGEPING